MKLPLFALIGLSMTACMPRKAISPMPEELTMLVGTYTNKGSEGIYTFRFNQETGTAQLLDTFTLPNPSYLTLSANEKRVYAVSEMNDSSAALHALAFDAQTGKLTLLNSLPTEGADPCYVATNGKTALTANYSGGSISVFPLGTDGKLMPVDTLFEGDANGNDPWRQATAHVHCTHFSPDGKYLLATDFSADRILTFVVHPEAGTLMNSPEATVVEPGSGPRHLTFHPNGKNVYLINELSGRIDVFNYLDGKLKHLQGIAADTVQARGSADIHISPDGKYLYASNRLKADGIAIFEINPADGTLWKVGYQLTGIHPRNFQLTPNGKYLLVACRDSDVIQVYRRDAETGLLTDTRQDIRLSQPVCIQWAGLVNNP